MTIVEQQLPLNVILQGNVLDRLRGLPSKKFKTVITSSPYLGMRFYGTDLQVWDDPGNCAHEWKYKTSRQHAGRGDGQKGGKYSEQEPYPDIKVKSATCKKCDAWLGELGQEGNTLEGRDKFLNHLWQICDELYRILEDDGTLWFNLGDKRDKDGSLLNVPHAFLEGMIRRGWKALDDIVWFKRSVAPQSNPGIFTPDYEPIFHFAKREAPVFYANAVLGIMQREEPPGTDGVEGKDWAWVPRRQKPKDKVRKQMWAEVKINGRTVKKKLWHAKRSLWQPYTYFHETQYRPYSEASLKQIERSYNGQSKKHQQATLDGLITGAADPSETKRNIIESIKSNLPAYGGKKAKGYGNSTYSGQPWQPELDPRMARNGSNIKGHSGILNADGEPALAGDPEYGSYERTVWDIIPARFAEAHFATFPQELVQRCIKSSCPEQICTKCRLGWRKMYSEERKRTRPGKNVGKGKSGTDDDPNSALHKADLSRYRETIIRREAGIMKCACGAPTEPGVVLDPFMGSGTTAIAAISLSRNWLGIELNPDYIKLAMSRIASECPDGKLL